MEVYLACTVVCVYKQALSWSGSLINVYEPCHEKMCLRESQTRQDTNWPAQLQRPARILKFRIYNLEVPFRLCSKQQRCWSDCRCAGWSAPLLFAYGIRHIFSWPGSHRIFSRRIWANSWVYGTFRPCKLMRSHPVGLDVWFLVGPFIYFQSSCVRTPNSSYVKWLLWETCTKSGIQSDEVS